VAVHHHDGAYTNQTLYLHNNNRGDVTTVRSGTSTVATYRYSAYGEVREQTGSYNSRLGISSKEYDESVGLDYFGYRYYDPEIARWHSKDPIGLMGGLNLYVEADNDPLRSIDVLGLCRYRQSEERPGFIIDTWKPWSTIPYAWVKPDYAQEYVRQLNRPYWWAGVFLGVVIGDEAFPWADPTKAPEGFEWNGRPGSTPGSKEGNYYNRDTGESLRPELDHGEPIGPHWDYRDPEGDWWRIYLDGRKERK
jgi:RHS repeat-associated protein